MATSAINTEKWETRINATVTNIKEVKAFVDWRLSIYKEKGWKGFDLWESFVDDFESFTKDILNDLGKDRLKTIRDYLRENRVYIRKEARKSIADGLLGAIHEPTPSKWPADDPTDDDPTDNSTDGPTDGPTDNPTDGPTDGPTDDPTDSPTDDPTDDPTPALPSLSTAPVQIMQPTLAALTPTPAQITQATNQLTLQGSLGREITNYNKLFTACQDVLACKPACFRPATTLAGLISDIKSSIATYGKQKQEIKSYYTDRRYHSSDQRYYYPPRRNK
jgi:hypothetical protein